MPFKDKADTAEAMRRLRARRRKEKEEQEERIMAFDKTQKRLSEILEELGFKSIPFEGYVQLMQEEYTVDGDGVRARETGKLIDPPEVFIGLNMLVSIETPCVASYNDTQDNG